MSVSFQFFETQECERINYFRNALWLHVNQLSQDCVQNDEVHHMKVSPYLHFSVWKAEPDLFSCALSCVLSELGCGL